MKEDRASGRSPLFEVFDYTSKRLVWPPARNSTSHPLKKLNRRLISRPTYLRSIDKLSPREYEALPCTIIKLTGSRYVHLTPPGNEWGVDFFGSIENPSQLSVFNGTRSPIRIVGQCKKYESKLEVKEVKEFSRTLEALRNRNPLLEKHVPIWFRTITGPIIPWLVCHSAAQSGALALAKDEGIIVSDSIDLAECLCFIKKTQGLNSHDKSAFLQKCCQEMIV